MRQQSFKCNINFQACLLPAAGRFGGGRRVPGGRAGAKSRCSLHETAHLPSPNGSSFSQPAVMVSASSPFPVRSAELPACNPQTRVSPQAVGSRGSSRRSTPGPPSPEARQHGQPAPLLLRHHTLPVADRQPRRRRAAHLNCSECLHPLCSWHLLACQDAPF